MQFTHHVFILGIVGAFFFAQPVFAEDTTFTNAVLAGQSVVIQGELAKSYGTFVIDHPLDPKNKLLYHSFVESPEMRDLYDGVAVLDEEGAASIVLPPYFSALNEAFRFQVKPLSMSQPGLFVHGVRGNTLRIAGGSPFARVSWQVTGRRHDPYAVANRVVAEVDKGPGALVAEGEYYYEGNRPRIEWLLPYSIQKLLSR